MIKILVNSDFKQMWRYNTTITCCGFSTDDEQLFTLAKSDYRGEVLSPIENHDEGVHLCLETDECHHIRAIIYIVPNTIPQEDRAAVADHPPFPLEVSISTQSGVKYSKVHHINQWGGAAIEIKLEM